MASTGRLYHSDPQTLFKVAPPRLYLDNDDGAQRVSIAAQVAGQSTGVVLADSVLSPTTYHTLLHSAALKCLSVQANAMQTQAERFILSADMEPSSVQRLMSMLALIEQALRMYRSWTC